MWRAVLSRKYGFRARTQEGEEQMNDALLLRIEECRKLPLQALLTKYQKLFGESPRSGHKDYLFRRIVWRLQANRYGDLSDQARQRASTHHGSGECVSVQTKTAPRTRTRQISPRRYRTSSSKCAEFAAC